MLLGSTLLEVAIGVIFVYLLVSLLCSALAELIEAFLKYRARDLEKGITKLLDDPNLAKDLYNHPLVRALGERPSYIPARTFSLALWNIATTKATETKNVAGGVTQNLGAIRNLIASLEGPKYEKIRTSLLSIIDEAGGDLTKARANVEAWYDDAMDRVSGWYKRRTHFILIVIGLIAASLLNIDTINIVKALLYNDTLRASVVASADNYLKTNPTPTPTPKTTPTPETAAAPTATPQDKAASAQMDKAEKEVNDQAAIAREKINKIRGELNNLGLPIGWDLKPQQPKIGDEKYKDLQEPQRSEQYNQDLEQYKNDLAAYKVDPRRFPSDGYSWFLKILGLILTALAVSQGAPFWFDLLNKFVVIRSTVKPREKSPDQPSKDKPAPETTKKQTETANTEDENKG